MPVSDFLPFATSAGANVMTQIDFAADPATHAGYTAGIAQSAKANKVWRQSSFVAAGITQMMVQRLGKDILDNGDLQGFTSDLAASFLALYPRRVLTGPTNFYVDSAHGADANDGMTTSTPWLTLQRAANALMDELDLNGESVTVHVAHGNYGPMHFDSPMVSQGEITFLGDPYSPASVLVTGGNSTCVYTSFNAYITLRGMSFQATGTGYSGVAIHADGAFPFWQDCNFGPCSTAHILSTGGYFRAIGPYTISGSAPRHLLMHDNGDGDLAALDQAPFSITLTGPVTFSDAFVNADLGSMLGGCFGSGVSFVNPQNATGTRFKAYTNSIINTQGGGINYFPGTVAGVLDTVNYAIYT